MTTRTLQLVVYRNSPTQRAHFAIYVPSANLEVGTLIHAVGAPMAGYRLEFKRNYSPGESQQPHTMVPIGEVDVQNIADSATTTRSTDSTPKDNLENAASQVPTPRISENFMAPVNDTTNKRCQEWTMEYVRRLVDLRYIGADAIEVVQSKRDPPTHGIGLQSIGRGRGRGGGA